MQLTVLDRILCLQAIPETGNLATMRIVQELRTKLGFTAEELEGFGLRVDDATGQVVWDSTQDTTRDIPICAAERRLILEGLWKLDKAEKLTTNHVRLFEIIEKEGGDSGQTT